MLSSPEHLSIINVQAMSYREPVDRTFSDAAEGSNVPSLTNLSFVLEGQVDGRSYKGFGETFVPNRQLKTVPWSLWAFSETASRALVGRSIPLFSTASAEEGLQAIMEELNTLAESASPDPDRNRPFHHTLAGIKTALLDLVIQAGGGGATDFSGATAQDGARRDVAAGQADRTQAVGKFYERVLSNPLRYACSPPAPMPVYEGRNANIYEGVTYLHPLGSNGTKGHLLEREALALGLSTLRYTKGTFAAMDGKKDPLLFMWSRSPISSCVSLALCTHKEATRARLRREGVPVPRGRMFRHGDYDSGFVFADRIGYPVVCKPATGVRGIGVVANIQNRDELKRAFDQMANSRLGRDDFIVEKHVSGGDYRIIVIDGEVVAAILREPASVVGDGDRTVAELMLHKNAARRLNPHLWGRPAKYEEAARYQLERAGLTINSVPEKGRRVLLANTCSLSQGGDSIDVLDELHPTVRDAAVAAVRAIPGLGYCGVDFLMEDHRKPIHGQSAGICELNAHAALGNCEYPLFGQPRQVARHFMRRCVELHDLDVRPEAAEELSIQITVRGRVTGVGYRNWLQGLATRFGVRGWVRNHEERVEAVLVGDTAPVSALAAGAILGPKGAHPTSVRTVHVERPDVSGFEIRRAGAVH